MKKKTIILIVSVLVLAILIGGGILCWKKAQIAKEKTQKQQIVQMQTDEKKQTQQTDVWYEMSIINIKIKIKKNIADKFGCKEYYIENKKVDGCKLYVVSDSKEETFGYLLEYKLDSQGFLLNGPHKNTKWNEICTNDFLFFKSADRMICYSTENDLNAQLNSEIEKEIDSALKSALVEEIK